MKKFNRSVMVLSLLSIAMLASCNGGDSTGKRNTSKNTGGTSDFYVNYKEESYDEGKTLNATVGETVGILVPHATDASVTLTFNYSSSDDTVVEVNTSGLLTFKKAGTADVTVSDANDANASMTFTFNVTDSSLATGGQSYTNVSYEEKGRILGTLEKYAVDNYLTGITVFSNGSNVCYNTRYVPQPTSYITGYGWGTTREGKSTGALTNPLAGENYGNYYNVATSSLPAHANAINASGSDVSTVYGYIQNAYYATRLNKSNDGYEWYPQLATDEKPIPVNADGTTVTGSDVYNSRWRIHLRSGVKYRTGSTASYNGVNVADTYDKKEVKLEDYLTPIKFALTGWNAQYRGSEMTTGVSGFAGAADYYSRTASNKTGDSSALWDDTAWNETMKDNIKVGTDSTGDYIEFNLLYPCTQFYAMYYLSNSLYSPLPADFIKLWGHKALGKFMDGGYTPADTMLSTGAYYIEDWTEGKRVLFKKNSEYFEKQDTFSDGSTRDVYNWDGIAYNYSASQATSKQYFLNGQIDSYAPDKDDLKGDFKNSEGSNTNMSWRKYETKGDSNFKLNVNACTDEQWTDRFGTAGKITQHGSGVTSTNTWTGVKAWMSNKHFLNFLSYSLDRQTICESRGMKPTQEYLSDNYLIDPESGVSYNSTEAHKAVLADRYNSTYGYNTTAAKQELKLAMDEVIVPLAEKKKLKASGSGTGGTSKNPWLIPIDMEWMNATDEKDYGDFFDSINKCFSELIEDQYDGCYKLNIIQHAGSSDYQEVYTKMKSGEFDLGFGAISGNDLNPLNFLEVLKSDNSSGFTLNWGPYTNEVSDSIVYDGKTWSFDGLWAAADSGVLLTQSGTQAGIENISTNGLKSNYKYYALSDEDQSVTYKLSFKQLTEAGAILKNLTISDNKVDYELDANKELILKIDNTFNTVSEDGETAENKTVVVKIEYEATIGGRTNTYSTYINLLTYKGQKA